MRVECNAKHDLSLTDMLVCNSLIKMTNLKIILQAYQVTTWLLLCGRSQCLTSLFHQRATAWLKKSHIKIWHNILLAFIHFSNKILFVLLLSP